MTITLHPTIVGEIQTFSYATLLSEDPRTEHVAGFQLSASSQSDTVNCLFMHVPGNELEIVTEAAQTKHFMTAVTGMLPSLEPIATRPGGKLLKTDILMMSPYYCGVAESPHEILKRLRNIPEHSRPVVDTHLAELVLWFTQEFTSYGFVMICWRGYLSMQSPVIIKYVPNNDDVLFAPGIVATDGELPKIGTPSERNQRVSFAVEGYEQPFRVHYHEPLDVASTFWAPSDVTGFFDNRNDGNNSDYLIPIASLQSDRSGWELIDELII
jgi:hypothetical protein